jgi:hypothetical protein
MIRRSVSVGVRSEMLGSDEGVGIAVADDLKVEVVGMPAATEHGVQLLPGLLSALVRKPLGDVCGWRSPRPARSSSENASDRFR